LFLSCNQTEKTKAEARLETLKLGDVAVDQFLDILNNDVVSSEDEEDLAVAVQPTVEATTTQQDKHAVFTHVGVSSKVRSLRNQHAIITIILSF